MLTKKKLRDEGVAVASYLLFLGTFSAQVLASEREADAFQVTASVQNLWDSNFSRSPINDSEQAVLSSVGFSYDDFFGRQRLLARWVANKYQYDEHQDFDITTHSGELNWLGFFGDQFNTNVDFQRNVYQVDRFDFTGKDIVTRDDLRTKVGYGNENKLSFHIGADQLSQVHSNYGRQFLNYDEHEAFVDVSYKAANESSLLLRYKSGNRTYANSQLSFERENLDFNYDQLEFETQWVLSPKTSVSALVAGYKRNGDINDGSGSLLSLATVWQPTEKVVLKGGYALSEPAVGETSDSPSRVKTISTSVSWSISNRVAFGSSAVYSNVNYSNAGFGMAREETRYNILPLTMVYDSGYFWKIKVDSGVRKNRSPVEIRNYISRQINAGIFFYY